MKSFVAADPGNDQTKTQLFNHSAVNVVKNHTVFHAGKKTARADTEDSDTDGDEAGAWADHVKLFDVTGPIPDEWVAIPFGVADIKRRGTDVTIVATSCASSRSSWRDVSCRTCHTSRSCIARR